MCGALIETVFPKHGLPSVHGVALRKIGAAVRRAPISIVLAWRHRWPMFTVIL